MRRLAMLAAAGLALTLGTAGCGSDSDPAGGGSADASRIKLVVASYSDKTQPYWQDLIASFRQEHPGVQVDLQVIDWNHITQQVNTMVQTRQLPDILNLNTFAGFASNGLLHPAKDVVSPEVLDGFVPTFADNSQYEGTQYGLPFIASARALFYNKDIFAKAGIAAPPTTWDELLAAAKKATAAGYVGYGLPLGAEEAQAEWSMWMWGNGGAWKSGDQWSVNSAENVETLEFLKRLATVEKVTEPNPGRTNRTDGIWSQFAQGRVAMCMGMPGTLAGMIEKAGNKVDYGVAGVPVNAGKPAVTLGVQDYLMAFKKPGNQQPVRDFLNYFYRKDNYVKFLTREGFLPTTEVGKQELAKDPQLSPFIAMLDKARFYPSEDPNWPKVQGAVQNQLGTAIEPNGSPKQVLDRIQQVAGG
jgi:multiple sugar transport system substrate-binding protein